MTCWRCGRVVHADWCSDGTPNDCDHCGGNPCRWWCDEFTRASRSLNAEMPSSSDDHAAYVRERNRRIAAGTWIWSAA